MLGHLPHSKMGAIHIAWGYAIEFGKVGNIHIYIYMSMPLEPKDNSKSVVKSSDQLSKYCKGIGRDERRPRGKNGRVHNMLTYLTTNKRITDS